MIIKTAQFLQGIVPTSEPLNPAVPQVVLYGRSNAGKSSTVNCLTGNTKLARASDTPGRTKEANVFVINQSWYLIDMPGYGYAAASKQDRESIHDLINWFIHETKTEHRKSILIIDSKIGLTDSDREVLSMLIDQGESITILMNKIDRLTQAEVSATAKKVRAETLPEIAIIPFSAKSGKGLPALLDLISN